MKRARPHVAAVGSASPQVRIKMDPCSVLAGACGKLGARHCQRTREARRQVSAAKLPLLAPDEPDTWDAYKALMSGRLTVETVFHALPRAPLYNYVTTGPMGYELDLGVLSEMGPMRVCGSRQSNYPMGVGCGVCLVFRRGRWNIIGVRNEQQAYATGRVFVSLLSHCVLPVSASVPATGLPLMSASCCALPSAPPAGNACAMTTQVWAAHGDEYVCIPHRKVCNMVASVTLVRKAGIDLCAWNKSNPDGTVYDPESYPGLQTPLPAPPWRPNGTLHGLAFDMGTGLVMAGRSVADEAWGVNQLRCRALAHVDHSTPILASERSARRQKSYRRVTTKAKVVYALPSVPTTAFSGAAAPAAEGEEEDDVEGVDMEDLLQEAMVDAARDLI